jgi:hypothetical protein
MTHEPPVSKEKKEPGQTAQTDREEVRDAGEPVPPRSCEAPGAQPFLFDDPYWDEAFDSYHDPTLRTCCRS